MKLNIPGPRPGGRTGYLQILGIVIIPLLLFTAAQSPTDLMNGFQNLTKISPVTGNPSGNATEAMTQYMNGLNGMSSGMTSLLNQIMGTLGMGNQNFFGPAFGNNSGSLQESLQRVMNQINGSGTNP